MKIKSVKAGVHRLSVTVPLLKAPINRNTVFCEVETDDGYVGHGITGGAYLPFAIVGCVDRWAKACEGLALTAPSAARPTSTACRMPPPCGAPAGSP